MTLFAFRVEGGDHTLMGAMPHFRSGDVEQIVRELFFTRFGIRCTSVEVHIA